MKTVPHEYADLLLASKIDLEVGNIAEFQQFADTVMLFMPAEKQMILWEKPFCDRDSDLAVRAGDHTDVRLHLQSSPESSDAFVKTVGADQGGR